MGLFNSIIVDLTCPVTDEVSKDNEIQIKWQSVDTRGLQTYRLGDTLEQLESQYDNTWIKSDYICNSCSPKTAGRKRSEFIRCSDQRRHPVFVRIEHGELCEILTEVEFHALGELEFLVDW
jgi:hypothetical protein